MTTPVAPRGRGWAYTGALLGGAVSIAANIAHSYIPPTHAPADWTPEAGAVIGSVFWPIALFVAVEILARIPWPDGRRWTALRFGGLVPVALVAAVVSYRHLSGLLDHYGEDALTVLIGPLAVDGLMVMATGALLATAGHTTAVIAAIDTTAEQAPELETADTPAPSGILASDSAPVFAPWAPAQLTPATKPAHVDPARVNGHQPATAVTA